MAALEAVLALRAAAGCASRWSWSRRTADLRYPPLEVVEPFGSCAAGRRAGDALAALGARHRLDAIDDVDAGERRVQTRDGAVLRYEALVLASARAPVADPGRAHYGDRSSREDFAALLAAAEAGHGEHSCSRSPRRAWPLPLYELAVMTARRLQRQGAPAASARHARARSAGDLRRPARAAACSSTWSRSGSRSVWGTRVERVRARRGRLAHSARRLPADRVVTIPPLGGPALCRHPHDDDGFIPVDAHGAVRGLVRRLRGWRRDRLPDKAGRPRDPAGRCGRRGDRCALRRGVDARAVPAGAARHAADGRAAALPRGRRGEGGARVRRRPTPLWWPPAEGRRAPPLAVPRARSASAGADEPPPGRGRWMESSWPAAMGETALDGSAPRVLVAGGGVAALEALLALRRARRRAARLTLIAPEPSSRYRPLAVLEPFVPGSMPTLSPADVVPSTTSRSSADALAGVRRRARRVRRDGTRMPYDELVVAVGAQPQPVVAGGIALGSLADIPALAKLVAGVRAGAVRRVALVVPEGIAWTLPLYELALQLGAERGPAGAPSWWS